MGFQYPTPKVQQYYFTLNWRAKSLNKILIFFRSSFFLTISGEKLKLFRFRMHFSIVWYERKWDFLLRRKCIVKFGDDLKEGGFLKHYLGHTCYYHFVDGIQSFISLSESHFIMLERKRKIVPAQEFIYSFVFS